MPIDGNLLPKPPVTWVASYELNEQERVAWLNFYYRLKDGVVVTGLSDHDNSVLLNTASGLYDIFSKAGVSPYQG